ncbi:MAG: hypothetical protein LBV54_04190, partial [Puniceicoccales bacterium]|nr:hypothetical protein [Puniceicoccales bacterium]
MQQTTKFLFLTIAALLFVPQAVAQDTVSLPFSQTYETSPDPLAAAISPVPLLPPKISANEAGEYSPYLKKIDFLLKKKRLWEFYSETFTLSTKIDQKRSQRTPEEENNSFNEQRSEAVAYEWIIYYSAKAPLVSFKENVERDFLDPAGPVGHEHIWSDIDVKSSSIHELNCIKTEEVADLLSLDKKMLGEMHSAYYTALMSTYFKASKIALAELKKERESFEKGPVTDLNKTEEIIKFRINESKFSNACAYWARIYLGCDSLYGHFTEYFVKYLITAFPNNGAQVRDYIRKAGFSSDFDCAFLL